MEPNKSSLRYWKFGDPQEKIIAYGTYEECERMGLAFIQSQDEAGKGWREEKWVHEDNPLERRWETPFSAGAENLYVEAAEKPLYIAEKE